MRPISDNLYMSNTSARIILRMYLMYMKKSSVVRLGTIAVTLILLYMLYDRYQQRYPDRRFSRPFYYHQVYQKLLPIKPQYRFPEKPHKPEISHITRPKAYKVSKALLEIPETSLSLLYKYGYLPSFKNPCWSTTEYAVSRLQCLPYFYLSGTPGSGITLLYNVLVQHPDIEPPDIREPRFWSKYEQRKEFAKYPEYFSKATTEMLNEHDKDGYHRKITFDASPEYFTNEGDMLQIQGNSRQTDSPKYTLAHTLYALNPNTKIIVVLRNPIDRLYSQNRRLHMAISTFEKELVNGLRPLQVCFQIHSQRRCLFDQTLDASLRMKDRVDVQHSIYHPFAKEWLSVFPRQQMLFLKAEELYTNITATAKQVYSFLELGGTPDSVYEKLRTQIGNTATSQSTGSQPDNTIYNKMSNTTRQRLDKFLKPFNRELAVLLNDTKWHFEPPI